MKQVTRTLRALLVLAAGAVPASASDAGGSCQPSWVPTFGAQPGVTGNFGPTSIQAFTTFDSGNGAGAQLVMGGNFFNAGNLPASNIATWDGATWSPLGAGTSNSHGGFGPGTVTSLATFDSGSGPELYAGGTFQIAGGAPAYNIAKWDGSAWSPVGGGLGWSVYALEVFDDGIGAGPALYAGGSFTSAGGAPGNFVARWDGASWSAVGSGMDGPVTCLEEHDDGSGPALYAGGAFTSADGSAANHIAKWDGTSWSALGTGTSGVVGALAEYDDGGSGGAELYVGGSFATAGGVTANGLARWDGASWSSVGGASFSFVASLQTHDDGSSGAPALFVGGSFWSAYGAPANTVARWDGASWSALGSGMSGGLPVTVSCLTEYDDGSGAALFAGGTFETAGTAPVLNIAKWDGASWTPVEDGLNGPVAALADFDDGAGAGPCLYVGGSFTGAAGMPLSNIARWDGAAWSSPGGGLPVRVAALEVFDDGTGGGPALYAGGHPTFTPGGPLNNDTIMRWDGTTWSPPGNGVFGSVVCFAIHDDGSGGGPALYAGGQFTVSGGTNIAKWDGASWSSVGTGPSDSVYAIHSFDDGSGPLLYAGGTFTSAGGVPAKYLAKWNGTSWSALGGGRNGYVQSFADFDDGTGGGPALYVGGEFTTSGGVSTNHVAKWNGTGWSPLGSGMGGPNLVQAAVGSMIVHDDGSGPALYAGGSFTSAGGSPASGIARWDGTTWSALGQGASSAALHVFDDGSGPALFAGGGSWPGTPESGDSYLAKWGCGKSVSYCTAGTSSSGCRALLSARGTASATLGSGLDLSASGVEGATSGLFFFGTSGRQAKPWGSSSSFQCVVPPVSRTGALSGTGSSGQCDGTFALDLNALWCPTCARPAKNPGAGATVQVQLWYHDPLNTSNQSSSLSDAIEFWIGP